VGRRKAVIGQRGVLSGIVLRGLESQPQVEAGESGSGRHKKLLKRKKWRNLGLRMPWIGILGVKIAALRRSVENRI